MYKFQVEREEKFQNPFDYTTPHLKKIPEKRVDFINPRSKTLDRLGMGKFDSCKHISDLKLQKKVPDALKKFKKELKMENILEINHYIKLGIVREVRNINSRLDARRYASAKPKNRFGGDLGKSVDKTSLNNSMSPSKG